MSITTTSVWLWPLRLLTAGLIGLAGVVGDSGHRPIGMSPMPSEPYAGQRSSAFVSDQAEADSQAPQTQAPGRISGCFLAGINYPYLHYGNDFGANAWGSYGLHDPDSFAEVDRDFARMAGLGIRVVRWFVFADGRAGIVWSDNGRPVGLDPFVMLDLDLALEVASTYGISLDLVLLDFPFMSDARLEDGVMLGGHADVVNSPDAQRALIDNVFRPIFRQYAASPSLLSWEVMNEPEWTLRDAGKTDPAVRRPSSLANFRTFVRLVAEAVHESSPALVTLGSASAEWLPLWAGLGLDFYQAHYYDWMRSSPGGNLLRIRGTDLRLDRPVVVGEFPATNSKSAGLSQYLDNWYGAGYAGAWPWSFRGVDQWGQPDLQKLAAWNTAHAGAECARRALGSPVSE